MGDTEFGRHFDGEGVIKKLEDEAPVGCIPEITCDKQET